MVIRYEKNGRTYARVFGLEENFIEWLDRVKPQIVEAYKEK